MDSLVASVLVQCGDGFASRMHDTVVQLSVMDTGPLGWHFSTSVGGEGSEVAMHGKSSEGQALLVKALLQEAVALSHLRTGDHVLAGEAELLHSRKLAQRGEPLDLEGPLQVLASLAHGLNPSAP